jgi:predicted DCC family thiol-disulfide oxidoreductase YuxK
MQTQLRVFYDGACPLCSREMGWLMRRLPRAGIVFDDISAAEFRSQEHGLSKEALMKQIHAMLPDGSIITGMEVFRRLYAAAGLGWLLKPTGWPLLRPLFDLLYRIFARCRTLRPSAR